MSSRAPSPPLHHSSGTSLHRQVFVVLRDEITRGVYSAAGSLPREVDLCERFGVSRVTVRRALADLAALGLVDRRHGLGTFVSPDLPAVPQVPTLGVLDSLRETAVQTQVKVLQVEHALAPPDVAAVLHVADGEQAMHAVRLRTMQGVPLMVTDAWVPARHGDNVTSAMLRKQALYEVLQDQGVRFGRVIQEISAVLADPERAHVLQLEVGSSLLKMSRLMHDADDRPVLRLVVWMAGERCRVLMDIPSSTVNTLSAGQFVYDVSRVTGVATKRRPARAPLHE
jgi:GntR family transcriptional regulator